MQKPPRSNWLLYCRPGFEKDCAQEALRFAKLQKPVIAGQPGIRADCGYVVVALNEQKPVYREEVTVFLTKTRGQPGSAWPTVAAIRNLPFDVGIHLHTKHLSAGRHDGTIARLLGRPEESG